MCAPWALPACPPPGRCLELITPQCHSDCSINFGIMLLCMLGGCAIQRIGGRGLAVLYMFRRRTCTRTYVYPTADPHMCVWGAKNRRQLRSLARIVQRLYRRDWLPYYIDHYWQTCLDIQMKFRYDWSRLYRPLFVCAGVVLRSFIICAVLAHQKPIYPFGSARMHCSIKMECLMGCSWVACVRLNDCDQVYHYAPAIYRPLRASENLPLYT